jgi:hypothetical protein
MAEALGARLVAVHVLDRFVDVAGSAERTASALLYEEIPDASAELAESLVTPRNDSRPLRARKTQP